jgi:hypothetical protein
LKAKREPRHTFMNHREVTFVPLGPNGKRGEAILYTSSWNLLMKAGVSPNWTVVGRSVTTNGPRGATLMVARLLTEAGPGEKIRFRDNDPYNLRLENIEVIRGYSRESDSDLMWEQIEERKRREQEQLERLEHIERMRSRFYSIRKEDVWS